MGLTGEETYSIEGLTDDMPANAVLKVTAVDGEGGTKTFDVSTRLDTPLDVQVYRNGGILHGVIRELL
jgi:aconitate hydratase